MDSMTDDTPTNLVHLTADIVAAYVENNTIAAGEVAALVGSVHAALSGLGVEPEPEEIVDRPSPAQVRRSVTPEGLVSFIDGRSYKTLRRHLKTKGFTPESYRETFGLPADYPMVASAYAARRSELAKAAGLGQGGRKPKKAGPPKTRA
jgi:predicted transcriptional regulator